jgi:hypothetical protein
MYANSLSLNLQWLRSCKSHAGAALNVHAPLSDIGCIALVPLLQAVPSFGCWAQQILERGGS